MLAVFDPFSFWNMSALIWLCLCYLLLQGGKLAVKHPQEAGTAVKLIRALMGR